MADFATLARAENARRGTAGVAELATATFNDDDVYDYVVSCDPTDTRSRLREAVRGLVAAAKTSGVSIAHAEAMKEKGETGSIWKSRWESSFVGHVRKCRKGVIVMMDVAYMKDHRDPRGARRREWRAAASKGPKTRTVVNLVNPDSLPQIGFPMDDPDEEIKPDKEFAFDAYEPPMNGKDMYATIVVGPQASQLDADRAAARMSGRGTPLPGRAMVGSEGAARYGRGEQFNYNNDAANVVGEKKRDFKKVLIGRDTVHVLDSKGPRDYTVEDVLLWTEERAFPAPAPGKKDPISKEARRVQQTMMVWLGENVVNGNTLLRLAKRLDEGSVNADEIRMTAFRAAFPHNFGDYVGEAGQFAIWEKPRAAFAKALLLLPGIQKARDDEMVMQAHDYRGHDLSFATTHKGAPVATAPADVRKLAGRHGKSTTQNRAGTIEGSVSSGHDGYDAEAQARRESLNTLVSESMASRLESTKEFVESTGVKGIRSQYKKLVSAGAQIRAGKGQLPSGWKAVYDEDGDLYYVHFTDAVATYDDPRLTTAVTKSETLGAGHFSSEPAGGAGEKAQWTISALDSKRYSTMDKKKEDWKSAAMIAALGAEACTKKWNRYVDMLPNPKSIVKLPKVGKDNMSTYVNANFMRGPGGAPGTFIACMAPMKKSQVHFWRMVCEHNVKTIVMVTGLKEKGVQKCPEYFPQQVGEEISHEGEKTIATIKCSAQKVYGDYVNSTFEVTAKSGLDPEKKSTVSHWWYTAWPDHGVPSLAGGEFDVDGILSMVEAINAKGDGIASHKPQLVHCSAGVGRTGVVITLQNAMARLQKHNQCNLLDMVEELRNDRCLQVQQEIQYRFLHAAVVRYAEKEGREIVIKQKAGAKKAGAKVAQSTTMTAEKERAKLSRYNQKRGSVRRATDVPVDIDSIVVEEEETFGFPKEGAGGDE